MAEVMLNIVEDVLGKYKTIEVKKNLELDIDVGNILAVDNNPLNLKEYRNDKEEYLKSLARDNAQILINTVWKLPTERIRDVIVAKLPEPTTILPREKPLPKPKAPTRWEQFAKKKGIHKKKRSNLVWSDKLKEYRPRYGYRRAENDPDNNAIVAIPDNADPYVDYIEEKSVAKKERVAKNEYQRLRNIAIANNVRYRTPDDRDDRTIAKEQVTKAVHVVRESTASAGRFTEGVQLEDTLKRPKKRQKFEPLYTDNKKEREKCTAILKEISHKRADIDVHRAVNQKLQDESREDAVERRSNRYKSKKGFHGKSRIGVPNKTFKGKGSNQKRQRSNETFGKGGKRKQGKGKGKFGNRVDSASGKPKKRFSGNASGKQQKTFSGKKGRK